MKGIPLSKSRLIKAVFLFMAFLFIFSGCKKEKEMYHVGILAGLNFFNGCIEPFKKKMSELGYTEGKNVTYDVRMSDFDMAEYEKHSKEFVAQKVDLIFSFPTEASLVAKNTARNAGIPVVFNCSFIEDGDLVESIQNPGGNVSGVRYPGPDVAAKRMEIMLQIAPEAKTIWVPYLKGYPSVTLQIEAVKNVVKPKGLTIIPAPFENPGQVQDSLNKYGKSIDAVMTISDPVSVTAAFFDIFAKFAANKKIPLGGALYVSGGYGTLYGVNINIEKSGEQSAKIAAKILDGTIAGTIPVVSANKYIEIDYKRATEQGYTIPDSLIKQADMIIR